MASLVTEAAKTAHAAATALLAKAQVKPGDTLPLAVTVKETDPATPITLALTGKTILVGVPGAFTPPCSSHAPGYIEQYDAFKAKGVTDIYIIAVNDAFVTTAWKKKLAPDGSAVHFIADDQGSFIGQLGLLQDATGLLGAPRAKRFVLVANGDKVETVIVEEDSSKVVSTVADSVLALL
ncbi:Redoxin [Auriscalpium vulgare]|uniref:Redoxin n=1 Tax=Auriscalpium vulgare TaxID=40419 RepID=A0ACB8RFW8_9AGAM|nr:Redoxin [Auriscalpium vulgare]